MRVRMNTDGASRSGRTLARELGVLRLRTPTRFRPRRGDTIINWGDANLRPTQARVINNPRAVRNAVRKDVALSIFKDAGIPCPDFTTDRSVANEWIESGSTVVGRSITRGYGGRGISLYDSGTAPLPRLPLYTKYVKKRDEYRVFVVDGECVRVTQKRRRRGVDADGQVRNASNGWVYCQDAVDAPSSVVDAGTGAVLVLGLDFGAADVGYNAHYDAACVYEVNTAFGLEGTTLKVVANAIDALLEKNDERMG